MPKELILFEEGDWSLKQHWYNNKTNTWYSPVSLAHKHTNWIGKERWIPTNMTDWNTFYSGTIPPSEDWNDQCSKCGEGAPSELKTRFKLLED